MLIFTSWCPIIIPNELFFGLILSSFEAYIDAFIYWFSLLIISNIGTASHFLFAFYSVSFMLHNKRINKCRKESTPSPQEGSENPAPSGKIHKVARCRFKQIPQNTKFSILDPIYPLLGVSLSLTEFYFLYVLKEIYL